MSAICYLLTFFFFKQKTAYEMRISDWSSDVCSSDLIGLGKRAVPLVGGQREDGQLLPPRDVDGEGPVADRGVVGRVGEDDDRRLQSLRSVDRHHPHHVAACLGLALDVGAAVRQDRKSVV